MIRPHLMAEDPLQPIPAPSSSVEYLTGAILSAHILGRKDFAHILRRVHYDQELRLLASTLAMTETCVTPFLLDALGLPRLDNPSFWVTQVIPAVRRELDRRSRPPRTWGKNSPIAKMKAENRIEDVAERVTQLTKTGDKLKGRCPFHQERSASFYVFPDTQRWWCFGACGGGGDVVDLINRLRDRGAA